MDDAEKTAMVQRHEATPRLPPVEIEGALNGLLLLKTKYSRFKGKRSICFMRIGLQVTNFTWSNDQGSLGETVAMIAQRAERAGLFSLWVMDHFFQISGVGPASHEMLEGYSALAFAAARTNRIKLGTMVTGVTYRYPGLLVKTVTTLDVLSGGRAYLGIGAAWYEEEHLGLGVPFPPTAERFERLEETLQIAH